MRTANHDKFGEWNYHQIRLPNIQFFLHRFQNILFFQSESSGAAKALPPPPTASKTILAKSLNPYIEVGGWGEGGEGVHAYNKNAKWSKSMLSWIYCCEMLENIKYTNISWQRSAEIGCLKIFTM